MMCFENSTRKKTFDDWNTLHRLRWHLKEIVDYCDIIIEKITDGKAHATVTSTMRDDKGDHGKGNAVDLRARDIPTRDDRLEVERIVNERYPVPEEQRPTIKYYDKENSSYDPHFHVRVEWGAFVYPLCDCADPSRAGSHY